MRGGDKELVMYQGWEIFAKLPSQVPSQDEQGQTKKARVKAWWGRGLRGA